MISLLKRKTNCKRRVGTHPPTMLLVKSLRNLYEEFLRRKEIQVLVKSIQELHGQSSAPDRLVESGGALLRRQDLHLICFDFVCS